MLCLSVDSCKEKGQNAVMREKRMDDGAKRKREMAPGIRISHLLFVALHTLLTCDNLQEGAGRQEAAKLMIHNLARRLIRLSGYIWDEDAEMG